MESDLYSVLRVPYDAEDKEIAEAYRRAVESNAATRGSLEAQDKKLEIARNILLDPEKRKALDESLGLAYVTGQGDEEEQGRGEGGTFDAHGNPLPRKLVPHWKNLLEILERSFRVDTTTAKRAFGLKSEDFANLCYESKPSKHFYKSGGTLMQCSPAHLYDARHVLLRALTRDPDVTFNQLQASYEDRLARQEERQRDADNNETTTEDPAQQNTTPTPQNTARRKGKGRAKVKGRCGKSQGGKTRSKAPVDSGPINKFFPKLRSGGTSNAEPPQTTDTSNDNEGQQPPSASEVTLVDASEFVQGSSSGFTSKA